MTPLSRAYVNTYYCIETMFLSRTVSKIFSVKEWSDLETMGRGSFKVVENGAVRQIIHDLLLVGHYKYSCMLYHFFELFDVE